MTFKHIIFKNYSMIDSQEIDQNLDTSNYFFKIKNKIYFDENNYKNYDDLKKNIKINYNTVYLQTVLPVLVLVVICSISIFINNITVNKLYINPVHFLFLSIVIGQIFHNIQNCIHAGIHYNLHPNKNISDLISNILGLLTGSEVKEARKIHLKHHTLIGTHDDPENSYLYPLTIKKIIFYFTGIAIIQYALALNKGKEKSEDLKISFFTKIMMMIGRGTKQKQQLMLELIG